MRVNYIDVDRVSADLRPENCKIKRPVQGGSLSAIQTAFPDSDCFLWHDDCWDLVDEATSALVVDGSQLQVVRKLDRVTLKQLVLAPLPALVVDKTKGSKSEGAHRSTFCEVTPWPGFEEAVQSFVAGLDDTNLCYQSLRMPGRPGVSVWNTNPTQEEEVRGPVTSLQFHILNEIANDCQIGWRVEGGGKKFSFADAGAYKNGEAAITVEFKGRWQFPLEKVESLLAGLENKTTMADLLTGLQQVFGNAVVDRTRYMVIATGNHTVFIKRTGPLNKDLQISPTVSVDGNMGLFPTACWLYVMQEAERLLDRKAELDSRLVPSTGDGYPFMHKPQSPPVSPCIKKRRREEPSIVCLKARSTSRYLSTPPPAPGYTAQAAADGQPLNWSNPGGYRTPDAAPPPSSTSAAPCAEPSSAHAMPITPSSASSLIGLQTFSLSQLELSDKLGNGLYSSCAMGKYKGHDVAIKIFNTRLHAAISAFESDVAAHQALDGVHPPLTVKLLGTGLMEHLHPPTPFMALAMAGPPVPVMQADPQRIRTAWRAKAKALVKRVHAQNYMHGDLRPEHFRQTVDGQLLLIDLDQQRCSRA